jgi:c-di-GMP-binding flagellar brake protein YcgR
MASSSANENSDLCRFLTPDMKMQVKVEFGPNDTHQFTTRLIGYKSYHYLILDYPRSVHQALIVRNLTNSNVVIRGMSDSDLGHIIAFKSSIVQRSNQPFPMIFVRMPRHFVTKPIRQHKRIKLSLPVTIIDNQEGNRNIEGTLVDFSVSGCGVFINDKAIPPQDSFLQKDLTVSIKSAITEAIDTDVNTRIANVVQQANGQFVGLRFSKALPINGHLKDVLFEHTILDYLT